MLCGFLWQNANKNLAWLKNFNEKCLLKIEDLCVSASRADMPNDSGNDYNYYEDNPNDSGNDYN